MFNHVGAGPFDELCYQSGTAGREWLIVERRNKVLLVSQGNISSEGRDTRLEASAPSGLNVNSTMVAHHISTSEDGAVAKFLLSTSVSDREVTEGTFLPGCGVVTIKLANGKIQLTAQGHDYLSTKTRDCAANLSDPRFEVGLDQHTRLNQRWKFAAQQRSWIGETLPVPTLLTDR